MIFWRKMLLLVMILYLQTLKQLIPSRWLTLTTKVVMIGPYAIYPNGTVPLRMVPIAKALHSKGYSVSIILPPYDNIAESGREYTIGGVKICNVHIPKGFNVRTSPLTKHIWIANDVVRKALKLEPELIHVFVPTGISGLSAMLLIMRKWFGFVKIPIVVDIDDWFGRGGYYDVFLEQKRGVRYRLVERQQDWLLKRASAVTVASKTLQTLIWSLGVDRDRVFYVPNGPHQFESINNALKEAIREHYGLKDKKVILLYTRFSEVGVKRVIDVLKMAKGEIGSLTLLVVGKGELHQDKKLLQLAEKSGLKESVIYVGWASPEELPLYLAISDVAIWPFDDTLLNRARCPAKLVELMSLGKAIVADKVGQTAEYIQDEKSGILVEPGNTRMFAQSLTKVLEDAELREKLGKNAQERIWGSFNWDKLISLVEKAYRVASCMETRLRTTRSQKE
jgi:glycosyltransferase involved in cell wall biosynthesis